MELRDDLYVLNEVFTNPKIVKVFHGAFSDILSLQRCLSLYVVNLFDTSVAYKEISVDHKHHSLKKLIQKYCNIDIEKETRLSDWRIRPLTTTQMNYARQDTHYLLYIYDKLRINPDLRISRVIEECKASAKQNYHKPKCDPKKIYQRIKGKLNGDQYFIFCKLVDWREEIARNKDESKNFILHHDVLFNIAAKMPNNEKDLFNCSINKRSLDVLKQYKNELFHIIS